MKIAELGNSVDPNDLAHYEPPHLDQHCLTSSLRSLIMIREVDKILSYGAIIKDNFVRSA